MGHWLNNIFEITSSPIAQLLHHKDDNAKIFYRQVWEDKGRETRDFESAFIELITPHSTGLDLRLFWDSRTLKKDVSRDQPSDVLLDQ